MSDPIRSYTIDADTRLIQIRLAPSASIAGRIYDRNGNPVHQNSSVVLMRLAAWAGWKRLESGGNADIQNDGSYIFRDLFPGRYYLVAQPPAKITYNAAEATQPSLDSSGNAHGEVSARFPMQTNHHSQPFFTLHEGQHLKINLRFKEKMLHKVSGTVESRPPSTFSLVDADGGSSYLLNQYSQDPRDAPNLMKENFEAWLPAGNYYLSNGRPDFFEGPAPLEVSDHDLSDLSFSITAPQVKVPVEITNTATPDPFCDSFGLVCRFWYLSMIRFDPRGYVESAGDSTQTGSRPNSDPKSPRIESVDVHPALYTVGVAVTGNLYAKSATRGNTDLALEHLAIRPESPGLPADPIRVVLAEGSLIHGIVTHQGKRTAAYVYAIAAKLQSRTDFRLFQPNIAAADGKFEIQGLARGYWLVFASDIELNLDIHNPKTVAFWRAHGKIVRTEPGKPAFLSLQPFDPTQSD